MLYKIRGEKRWRVAAGWRIEVAAPNPRGIKKVSLPVISRLLRHKNLQTTERYLQTIDPRFRDTMRLLEGDRLEPTHNLLTKEKEGQKF